MLHTLVHSFLQQQHMLHTLVHSFLQQQHMLHTLVHSFLQQQHMLHTLVHSFLQQQHMLHTLVHSFLQQQHVTHFGTLVPTTTTLFCPQHKQIPLLQQDSQALKLHSFYNTLTYTESLWIQHTCVFSHATAYFCVPNHHRIFMWLLLWSVFIKTCTMYNKHLGREQSTSLWLGLCYVSIHTARKQAFNASLMAITAPTVDRCYNCAENLTFGKMQQKGHRTRPGRGEDWQT